VLHREINRPHRSFSLFVAKRIESDASQQCDREPATAG